MVEIDTPNLAYVIRRPGQYRVSVDPNSDATQVRTSNGQAEVYSEGASYVVDAGKTYRFFGTGLRDYEDLALCRIDEFDRWAQDRDRSYDNSISARYISRDVIGSQDLDAYGAWRAVPEYGNVWIPSRVSSGWAPYRDGHWAWVDPLGLRRFALWSLGRHRQQLGLDTGSGRGTRRGCPGAGRIHRRHKFSDLALVWQRRRGGLVPARPA